MKISTILPRDTRAIELVSAFALITTSVVVAFGAPLSSWLLDIQSRGFWIMILGSFGIIQLIGIVRDSISAEIVRAIVTWLVGMFWIWVSLEYLVDKVRVTEIASFILGVSNFYAFTINFSLLLWSKWK